MRKKIFILEVLKVMDELRDGKRIEGVLYWDKESGMPTFKAYNRKPQKRPKDKLLCYLEHGWVKESAQRIKVFESLPKRIGTTDMIAALERETGMAENVIVERDFFEGV